MSRREAIKRAMLVLGVAISPSLVRGVMAETTTAARDGTAGEQLAASQRAIIAAAAERILPRTDTPGAIDVGVPDFVAVMYGSYLEDAEKARLVRGLSQLDSLSATAHQRGFAKLEAGQQDAVLRQLAESADQEDGRCFQQLRELTVLGFFSSKTIGTTVLKYDPIPGRYEGNIPLSETGGASWYMA